MDSDYRKYVVDVDEAAREIQAYVRGLKFEEYTSNPIVWDIIQKNLPLLIEDFGKIRKTLL